METKWTPGPYTILYKINIMKGNRSIASCGGHQTYPGAEKTDQENEANAHLLSTAPLLFTELCRLHNWVWQRAEDDMFAHKAGELPEDCSICAAICRALGREI